MERDVICQGKPAVLTWVRSSVFGEEEVRIDWQDGTKRDDLLTKPQGLADEEWFKALVPDEFPAFTAQDGVTEKRLLVRIRELEERVARLEPKPEPVEEPPVQVGYMEEPEEIAIPAFLKEPEPPKDTIPEAIADLIRENEPYGEAQARLWALYVGLQNKLMLGLATEEDARLHTRLHGHLAWISKGAVEVTRD